MDELINDYMVKFANDEKKRHRVLARVGAVLALGALGTVGGFYAGAGKAYRKGIQDSEIFQGYLMSGAAKGGLGGSALGYIGSKFDQYTDKL